MDAIDYIHAKGVMHRDLKPKNILFDNDQDIFAVADFGLARECDGETMTSNQGTPGWRAPEQYTSIDYTKSVDIYALGQILFQIIYPTKTIHELNNYLESMRVKKVGPLSFGSKLSDIYTLCIGMLSTDPKERPTIPKIRSVLRGDIDSLSTIAENVIEAKGKLRFFESLEYLGTGNFGSVFKWKKDTNFFATKVIKKHSDPMVQFQMSECIELGRIKFNHSNIVKFSDSWEEHSSDMPLEILSKINSTAKMDPHGYYRCITMNFYPREYIILCSAHQLTNMYR